MMKPDPWCIPRLLADAVGVLLRARRAKKKRIPDRPECVQGTMKNRRSDLKLESANGHAAVDHQQLAVDIT
jgi:hypothetical protein